MGTVSVGKLVMVGLSLLAFHGGQHHRYWWPAHIDCMVATGTTRSGAVISHPYVTCVAVPGRFGEKPPPPSVLNPADNAAAPYGPCGYEGRLCPAAHS